MDTYWEMQFATHILARGKNYFEEGNVCRIYQFGNTVRATVKGTEDYNVEIDLPGGKPDFMLCTCPYAANNHCKHMAALLYAIDAGEYVFTEEKVKPHTIEPVEHVPVCLPWLEAIDRLPESVIRRIVMQLADRDDRLKERLSLLYLQGTPEGMLNNWRADLQQLAFQAVNRHGVMEYEEADIFMMHLHNFLVEKLAMLMEANAIMDAYQMVWIVLETALEQIYDEPDDSLQYLEGCCEDAWESIIGAASDRQKEQMLDMFWDYHEKIKWEYGIDGIEVDSFFLSLPWSREQHIKNSERLVSRITSTQDDGSNHAVWGWLIEEINDIIRSLPN